MDQFISSLPKTLLAIIVMVVALFALRQIKPPHTVCASQMDLFREQQKKFLYAPPPVGGIQRPALAKEMMDHCKGDNSPGGCFELFVSTKKMSVDLDALPDQCADEVAEEKEITGRLKSIMALMVQLAWGERVPASQMQKDGWYDTSEVSLFCNLRRHSIRFFGKEKYDEWQNETLASLPQSSTITPEQRWPRTLLATRCEMYR